jgi:hypothetical protein
VTARQSRDQPPDASKAFAKTAGSWNGFEQDAPLAQVEGDIDEIMIVRQADRIGSADTGCAAELQKRFLRS